MIVEENVILGQHLPVFLLWGREVHINSFDTYIVIEVTLFSYYKKWIIQHDWKQTRDVN